MQFGVAVVDLLQLRHALQRLRDRGTDRQRRNELGDAIDFAQRDVEHARHVAQRGFRAQCAVGDDLRDILAAIGAGDIIENFAAPRVGEVGVDIGHFKALAREEALEQQLVFDRVDIGDIQAVQHQRRAGRTTRQRRDAVRAGKLYIVPHDQHVVREAGGVDHIQLVVEPAHIFFGRAAAGALHQAFFAHKFQVRSGVVPFRNEVQVWQLHAPEIHFEVAHVGDTAGVFQRRSAIALEELPHLLARRDVVALVHLVVFGAEILHGQVEAHGHNMLLRLKVFAPHKVRVVGRHQWNAQLFADTHQFVVDRFQFGRVAVELQFQVVIVRAEQVTVPCRHFARFFFLLHGQVLNHFAGDARRGGDHAFVVLLEHGAVDARAGEHATTHAIEVRARGELDQVGVANFILRQQQHVEIVLAAFDHRVFRRAGCHIRFHANDRLDANLFRSGVEVHRAIHHAVVGQRNAVHPQFRRALDNAFGGGIAIEQAIFRMDMEMGEIAHAVLRTRQAAADTGNALHFIKTTANAKSLTMPQNHAWAWRVCQQISLFSALYEHNAAAGCS